MANATGCAVGLGILLWTLGQSAAAADLAPGVDEPETWTARALSLGTAVRADPTEVSNVLCAPGTLALGDRYAAAVGGQLSPDKGQTLQGHAMDTKTAQVGLGASYIREYSTPSTSDAELPGWREPSDDLQNPTEDSLLGIALAAPFLDGKLGMGVVVTRAWHSARFGEDDGGWNIGASGAYKLSDSWSFGFGGMNFSKTPYTGDPTSAFLAGRWAMQDQVSVDADIWGDFDDKTGQMTVSYSAGGEAVLQNIVPLRFGVRRDRVLGADFLSGGLGVRGSQGELGIGSRLQIGANSPDKLLERLWLGATLQISV